MIISPSPGRTSLPGLQSPFWASLDGYIQTSIKLEAGLPHAGFDMGHGRLEAGPEEGYVTSQNHPVLGGRITQSSGLRQNQHQNYNSNVNSLTNTTHSFKGIVHHLNFRKIRPELVRLSLILFDLILLDLILLDLSLLDLILLDCRLSLLDCKLLLLDCEVGLLINVCCRWVAVLCV